MATSVGVGRGAQTMNSIYLKPMLRKAYHRKNTSSDITSDAATKRNGEEMKKSSMKINQDDGSWWIRDDRTGIYYPKGQEKIIEDIPPKAGKDFGINWFSHSENR